MNGWSASSSEVRLEGSEPLARPRERHVLGVAFPFTDLAPPRDVELERTLLQLVYAVERLSRPGSSSCGYFAVLRQELRDAVQRLLLRYQVSDSVRIVFTSLFIADMTRLAEAADAAATGGDPSLVSVAGREIATETLRRQIAREQPGAAEVTRREAMPFGVPWDYYGTVSLIEPRNGTNGVVIPRLF